jgi:guanylate kinase
MKKYESMIICGPSASGKNVLLEYCIKAGLPYSPKITTRPKRNGETNGIDYIYTDNQDFEEMLMHGMIKTYQKFFIDGDIWYYGISKENFDTNQVFIMTPHEIKSLSKDDKDKCYIVYLDINEDIRKSRIEKRYDSNDSVMRRILADRVDFDNFIEYDLKISDADFDAEFIFSLMN